MPPDGPLESNPETRQYPHLTWIGDIEPEKLNWLAEQVKDSALPEVDQKAFFEQIVEPTYQGIYNVIFLLTFDEDLAKEITQETYERAWKKRGQFRGDALYSTWLHRIATNQVSTFKEKLGKRRDREFSVNPLEMYSATDFSNAEKSKEKTKNVHEIMLERITGDDVDIEDYPASAKVRAALGQLSLKDRKILALIDIEGYPHEEAATILGIKVNASKVRLHRARQRLRDIITGMED